MSFSLFALQQGEVGLVEMHAGVPLETTTYSAAEEGMSARLTAEDLTCGAATPSQHFILDAWPLPRV